MNAVHALAPELVEKTPRSPRPREAAPELTLQRFGKLVGWCVIALIGAAFSIGIGVVWGAVYGLASGIGRMTAQMVGTTLRDLSDLWEWVKR